MQKFRKFGIRKTISVKIYFCFAKIKFCSLDSLVRYDRSLRSLASSLARSSLARSLGAGTAPAGAGGAEEEALELGAAGPAPARALTAVRSGSSPARRPLNMTR